MTNKYAGTCKECGTKVRAGSGELEKIGQKWEVWCLECYNESDRSGAEDRQCGDRAYEDSYAQACGF